MLFCKSKKDKSISKEPIIIEYDSDSPIELNNQNDILGTNKIVDQIKSIIDVIDVSQGSFVIGLQGKRGSGKSSIIKSLNLDSNRYIVLEYSPRIYGNEINLYEKFFDELSRCLGSKKFCSDNSIKENLYKYKLALSKNLNSSIETFGGKIVGILLNLITSGLGITLLLLFKTETNVLLIILGSFIFLYSIGYSVIQIYQILMNFKIWNYYNSYTSIDGIKSEISKKLGNLDKKIIIIIDDIDRLKSDKISSIFQLVKSTANFNNIIYILSYDKDIINESFKNEYQQSKTYTDKFIQMELSLPKVTFYGISNELLKNAHEFINYCNKKYLINYKISEQEKLKLINFFKSELRRGNFTTIRDVKRFFNMIKVDFNILHKENKVEEIYIFDFILIEFIKYIDEDFYNWIHMNMGYVLFEEIIYGGRSITGIKDRIDKKISDDFSGRGYVFYTLFPFNTNGISCDNSRKICNSKMFDAYFSYIITGFSNTNLLDIIDNLKNNREVTVVENLNYTDSVKEFVHKVITKIHESNYDNEEEINNNILLLAFLINNEKDLNKYYDFIRGLSTDISRGLNHFLDHFINTPEKYKDIFYKIYGKANQYYQFFDYAYLSLNTDYEAIKNNEKEHIYQKIISDHNKLGIELINELNNLLKKKFRQMISKNTLRFDIGWKDSIRIGILLGWITKEISFKYLKDNNLGQEFIKYIIFGASSTYFENKCGENDIDLYVRTGKILFNKNKFIELVDEYQWNEYDNELIARILSKW